jgi:hypothetical protein
MLTARRLVAFMICSFFKQVLYEWNFLDEEEEERVGMATFLLENGFEADSFTLRKDQYKFSRKSAILHYECESIKMFNIFQAHGASIPENYQLCRS